MNKGPVVHPAASNGVPKKTSQRHARVDVGSDVGLPDFIMLHCAEQQIGVHSTFLSLIPLFPFLSLIPFLPYFPLFPSLFLLILTSCSPPLLPPSANC